jgi:hypothetical protein
VLEPVEGALGALVVEDSVFAGVVVEVLEDELSLLELELSAFFAPPPELL